jgi:chloramphenicol 3-O phosphotransferase
MLPGAPHATGAGEIVIEVSRMPGYCGAVTTQVIVLNGGSSSGKSGIARCLQAVLPDPWLAFGVDTLIRAMPVSPWRSGIDFASDGAIILGPRFRALEAAWIEGVAAMAHAGARIIVDEVFLGGATSQQRWKTALGALPVLWVGVRCDSAVAAGREIARGTGSPGRRRPRQIWSTRVSPMTWR